MNVADRGTPSHRRDGRRVQTDHHVANGLRCQARDVLHEPRRVRDGPLPIRDSTPSLVIRQVVCGDRALGRVDLLSYA